MNQPSLDFTAADHARDEALARIARVISPSFREQAERFVIGLLRLRGPSSGEVLVSMCEEVGIRSTDARHFGHVFRSLSQRGVIECVGYGLRAKGHSTAGSRMWKLRE